MAGPDFSVRPGDVLDVPDAAARAWIGVGDAVAADGEAVTAAWPYGGPETAEAPPAPETAAKPAAKRRR